MRIPLEELTLAFKRVLLMNGFTEDRAHMIAGIFAANSRDGVYSHGLHRFPVFIRYVQEGLVNPSAEPAILSSNGVIEQWHGNLGPGMYNATLCMERAVALAKEHGMGCVSIRHTNHWMRGGTYGWQAADAGCIGICFTNAIAGMPAWGGVNPVLGNNPLVIAVPREGGHVVLDMAMSQFSYGKLEEHELKGTRLPVYGGYDDEGNLTTDPGVIQKNKRALPIGFWKGSGLSLMLDILAVALSGGHSTAGITREDRMEYGVSQCFIAMHQPDMHPALVEGILAYTKSSVLAEAGKPVRYPGERTLLTRMESEREGVLVHEGRWKALLEM